MPQIIEILPSGDQYIWNSITIEGTDYEYLKRYTTLGEPSDLSNAALDGLYSISGIFTDIYLNQFLYDNVASTGSPGQVLVAYADGVRWSEVSVASTISLQSIEILDEGILKGKISRIDFYDGNDPNNLVKAEISVGSTNLANVYISDRWSSIGIGAGSAIYRDSKVGIGTDNVSSILTVKGNTELNGNLRVSGITTISGSTFIDANLVISGFTTGTISTSLYANYSNVSGLATNANLANVATYAVNAGVATNANLANVATYAVNAGVATNANLADVATYAVNAGVATLSNTIDTIQTEIDQNYYIPFVENSTSTSGETLRVDDGIKYNSFTESVTIEGNLGIGGTSYFNQSIELKGSLIDSNGNSAVGKEDYRLSSVGTGVSWRPPGVQTKRAIWVTMNGNDSNSGLLEGDAKATVGAAASVAQAGDTIFVRSGVYFENNPIGLRTDVSISGQDLRLVTIVPNNPTKDVLHVRRGCLVENLNFAGSNISVDHTGTGAVAFPSSDPSNYAVTGYIAPGPATEGETGRWRSPYIRNCTNFMTKSIGMKIDGDNATASTIGADLKSMVCDSFTQYNEGGIGVSITNSGYAQLVSIFTIGCDIGIYCDTGGSCSITNSNSSFGNFGLVAVGLGRTEFSGRVFADTLPEQDIIKFTSISDNQNRPRRPYDSQALWFKINLDNYPDAVGTGKITEPLRELTSIKILNSGSGFDPVSPPNVTIRDEDGTVLPKGPQGIIAQALANVNDSGQLTEIDIISNGRNYLPTQNIVVDIDGNTGLATAVMSPIYYTISETTDPTEPDGRYADAVSLIMKNLDFIASESVERMLSANPSFTVPTGNQRCVEDVKLVLTSIAYNLQFGGNDFTYDAAKIYVDNPYLSGEEVQSIETFTNARDIAKEVINNVTVTKINYNGLNTFNQIKDLSIVADPSTGSNTDPNSCANVKSSIDTLFDIINTAINPASSPKLPNSRTSGNAVGVTTVTFNEFIPFELFENDEFELRRISKIITSSHSFEYIGTGTDINTSTPFQGAVPIKENEVVALDGAQIPFTSSDQKGNFDIGPGIQIDQTTSSIRGRDFSRSIQAEVTPLILALR